MTTAINNSFIQKLLQSKAQMGNGSVAQQQYQPQTASNPTGSGAQQGSGCLGCCGCQANNSNPFQLSGLF